MADVESSDGQPAEQAPRNFLPRTDRSRIVDGQSWCMRRRYLGFHSGDNGYGIRVKKQRLALAQGIHVHRALETIVKQRVAGGPRALKDWRTIIHKHVDQYRQSVRRSGLYLEGLQLLQEAEGTDEAMLAQAQALHAEHEYTIQEQSHLLECLLWGFCRVLLEPLIEEFEVLEVEREEEMVIGCECGLGDGVGEVADHEFRRCTGIILMSRPDMLLIQRASQEICNVDFKSTGWLDDKRWRKTYEQNVQLAIGSAVAANRIGKAIPHSYILALGKGKYEREWDSVEKQAVGPKRQNHWLCYVYYKAGNPPFFDEEIHLKYDYVDEDGKNRKATKSKGFEKTPVWELEIGDPEQGVTPAEAWVAAIDEETLQKNFAVLGPFGNPTHMVASYFRGIVADERRINERLWTLYEKKVELIEEGVQHPEVDDRFVAELDAAFPQSRDCRRFNRDCEFLEICNREPGWANPLEEMDYKLRRPHHEGELQELRDLGMELPESDEEFDEEVDSV